MSDFVIAFADGRSRTFRSVASFQKWFAANWEDWGWFVDGPAPIGCVSQAQNALRQWYGPISDLLVNSGDREPEELKRQIVEQTTTLFPRGLTAADDPAVLGLMERYADDPQLAMAVGAVVATDSSRANGQIDYGMFSNPVCWEAIAFATVSRNALVRTDKGAAQRSLNRIAERLGRVADDVEAKIERREQELVGALDHLASDSQSMMEALNVAANASIARITDTEAKFADIMRLKSPMDLWDGKQAEHSSNVVTYRRWMAGLGAGGVVVLLIAYGAGWGVLDQYAGRHPSASVAMTVFLAGLLGAITAMVLWFIRIVVRLYMSQHHFAADAAERASLIRTYLALRERGSVSDDERALVLTAIFRPTPDGIVKDDGAPQLSPAALLAGMLDRKS